MYHILSIVTCHERVRLVLLLLLLLLLLSLLYNQPRTNTEDTRSVPPLSSRSN